MKLSPAVEYALASGWTSQSLKAHLSRRPDGVRYPAAVLARRLAELPTPPSTSLRRKTPWCGECEDEQSRTITVTLPRTERGGGILPPLQSTEAATVGRPEDSQYRRMVNQLETNVFDQLPLLLAVPRAAAILGISRAAAYRLAASGELPLRRLGGRVYVVTAELRELVAS